MNPFELLIIQPNIIPPQHIQELLKLTNQPTSNATVGSGEEKIERETRHTLWYPIPYPMLQNLTSATMSCYQSYIHPKYNSTVKNIEPTQFLGYPVGGHYIEHNDLYFHDILYRGSMLKTKHILSNIFPPMFISHYAPHNTLVFSPSNIINLV